MRRYWSGYVEAFFNIRHANIDIEISERKIFQYFELNTESEQYMYVCGSVVLEFFCLMHIIKAHVTYFRYHMGSASLVIFSFAFIIFFIWKKKTFIIKMQLKQL